MTIHPPAALCPTSVSGSRRAKVQAVRASLIPADVHLTVTRNYGETASEKSNELLRHLLLATVSVTVLIALFLGLRASLVVLVAIPSATVNRINSDSLAQ